MLRSAPLLAAIVLVLSIPAGAQPSDEVRMRLVSFSGWAAPDRPLTLSVEVTNTGSSPLDEVAVRLTILERIRSRSALRASLDGNPSGQPLALTTEQLDRPIAPAATVTIPVQRDLGSLANAFRSGRAQSGVYPLGIAIRLAGRTAVERFGAFVFLASPPDARLNLVWVMPVHRPLASDARGVYDLDAMRGELLAGGRSRSIVDLLGSHTAVPLTLAPSGLFADQLADLADGFLARSGGSAPVAVPATDPLAKAAGDLLARLRASVASPAFEIATAPYGRASLVPLVSGGLPSDARRQITMGREEVTRLLGRQPSSGLWVDGALRADARSARTFAGLGARTLILDPSTLRYRSQGRFGPDRVEEITASNFSFDAVLPDPAIRERLEATSDDPMLTAMGVVAETAASYFELPGLAAGRMLAVATASTPDPAVATPLLDTLSKAPWIRLRTASSASEDPGLRPSGEPQRLDTAPPDTSQRLAQARSARREVEVFRKILVPPSGADELDRLDRIVLASESADYDAQPTMASNIAGDARQAALSRLGQITVPARRITLTSRGGQVPITIRNLTGYTIRLHVRLDSQKVTFPTGDSAMVQVEGKLETVAFTLEARAAGSFPVEVRLETPKGDELIGTGQILVRSTAVSAVTFMATAGGALFLIGAWARRALTRRPKSGSAS